MKKITLFFIAAILVSRVYAQDYTPVDSSSAIKFSIKNFGIRVYGSFKGLKGRVSFNPANLAASSINVSVDATTINTGNGSRDGHLKKEEYFNTAKFPQISFTSTKISNSTRAGTLYIEGKVTIKGVTKILSFPFTATPKPGGYLFAGEFNLNRRDFGVGGSSLVMSDNLTVSITSFAKKI